MTSKITQTQQQLLAHHGGNGFRARQMISNSYENRHDSEFWRFWQSQVACHYQSGDGILDLGAGIGQFVRDCANRYPDAMVYGIDAAPYMVENPIALPENAKMLMDDLHQPQAEIKENSLAMAMANMMVHELEQPLKMFQASYRWLKTGGRFCVIDVVRQSIQQQFDKRYPNQSLWQESASLEKIEEAFNHYAEHNRYSAEDLIYLLSSTGFKLIENTPLLNGQYARIVVEK